MTDIKVQAQGIDPNLNARDIQEIAKRTDKNIYKALAVIHTRAMQLSNDLKEELHKKLEEFATVSDTIEEIQENKEQIEISKFYERLPNPTIIALKEYMGEELSYRSLNDAAEDSEDEAEDLI